MMALRQSVALRSARVGAGTPDELARVLGAMATEGGKSFIRYDESKEIRHAKVQTERIVALGK